MPRDSDIWKLRHIHIHINDLRAIAILQRVLNYPKQGFLTAFIRRAIATQLFIEEYLNASHSSLPGDVASALHLVHETVKKRSNVRVAASERDAEAGSNHTGDI